MSRTRLRLTGAAMAGFFVVFAAWLLAGWGGPAATEVVSDVGSMLAGGWSALCAAVTARATRGRQRLAWCALTVALGSWFFGDAVWAYYELVLGMASAPFPSPADGGYLLFPVAAGAALILLGSGYARQSQARLLLDGLIVAGSVFIIVWTFGLQEVFHRGSESRVAFIVSVAYPITDVLLGSVALLMLLRTRPGRRATVTTFAIALTVMAVCDATFVVLNADGTYLSGGLVDVGWVAALLLLGVAALLGRRDPRAPSEIIAAPSRTAMWLPYAPLPIATGCLVFDEGSTTLLAAGLIMVLAVLIRHFVVTDENRRLLARLAEAALRDPLTGLANRALLLDRLEHAVARQHRDGTPVAVLTFDLDGFKLVNDSLGHAAGDGLLVAVTDRVTQCVGPLDTVARLGGDEFAVLLGGLDGDPIDVAHEIYDAFDDPFPIDGHDVRIRPSVGLAAHRVGGNPQSRAHTLLKHADLAMYAAKRSAHGGVATFTADMELIDPAERRPARDLDVTRRRKGAAGAPLFAQLRRALQRDELHLVYQPKFTADGGALAGVEALVRWQHPERGLLAPDQFLPLVRQNGLMGALTDAVVARAAADAATWRRAGTPIGVAVNLFPPTLVDPTLPARIIGLVTAAGMPTDALTVEITEDFLLGNPAHARQALDELRRHHVRVSIDDFGSGYSALSYLRELPVDELKLDRLLVAPILSDTRAEAIAKAIIDLAHSLDLTCVAEGVEDHPTLARLVALGCDVLQGFVCSPPVDAAAVPTVAALVQTDAP